MKKFVVAIERVSGRAVAAWEGGKYMKLDGWKYSQYRIHEAPHRDFAMVKAEQAHQRLKGRRKHCEAY